MISDLEVERHIAEGVVPVIVVHEHLAGTDVQVGVQRLLRVGCTTYMPATVCLKCRSIVLLTSMNMLPITYD